MIINFWKWAVLGPLWSPFGSHFGTLFLRPVARMFQNLDRLGLIVYVKRGGRSDKQTHQHWWHGHQLDGNDSWHRCFVVRMRLCLLWRHELPARFFCLRTPRMIVLHWGSHAPWTGCTRTGTTPRCTTSLSVNLPHANGASALSCTSKHVYSCSVVGQYQYGDTGDVDMILTLTLTFFWYYYYDDLIWFDLIIYIYDSYDNSWRDMTVIVIVIVRRIGVSWWTVEGK